MNPTAIPSRLPRRNINKVDNNPKFKTPDRKVKLINKRLKNIDFTKKSNPLKSNSIKGVDIFKSFKLNSLLKTLINNEPVIVPNININSKTI